MRTLAVSLALLAMTGAAACGDSADTVVTGEDDIVGVWDARVNETVFRYWFRADKTWGSAGKIVTSGTTARVCDGDPGKTTRYSARSGRLTLEIDAESISRSYVFTENGKAMRFDPGIIAGSDKVDTFRRIEGATIPASCAEAEID